MYIWLFFWGQTSSFSQNSHIAEKWEDKHIDSSISKLEKEIISNDFSADSALLIHHLHSMVSLYFIKNDYYKAEKCLLASLNYHFVNTNPDCMGIVLMDLGNLYRYKNDHPKALSYYLNAQKYFEYTKNYKMLVAIKIELAEYYRKTYKFDKAKELIKESFHIYKENRVNDLTLEVKLYNRAAAIESESGSLDNTVLFSKKAINMAYQVNDLYSVAISLNELGFAYKKLEMFDSAISCYISAEKIWLNMGANREALHAMNNRAMLYAHHNYTSSLVIDLCQKIIHLVEENKIDYSLRDPYLFIFLENAEIGDTGQAFIYLKKFHDVEMQRADILYNEQLIKIAEQYENVKIKEELLKTSQILDVKEQDLVKRQKEKVQILILVAVLGSLLLVIIFLLLRLQKVNKKIMSRNKEKDVFIQEIHHRVKNNLQFVSSLINMQMNASSDSAEIYSLNDASRRIKAMALVHEMLYQYGETLGVSIKQYLEELIASLNDIVNSRSIPVKFNTSIKDQNFGITSSIALGIITSELISNSIKYAFDQTKHPQIDIVLEQTENGLMRFMVKDNGKGLIDIKNDEQKLGMRLIDIFSRQLKGTYQFINDRGCVYEINFKIK